MKKSIVKYIRQEAAKLPPVVTTRKHTQRFTGKEILEANQISTSKIPKSKLERIHSSTTTQYVEVNHETKMKDAYHLGGIKAIDKYIKDVLGTAGRATLSPGEHSGANLPSSPAE